MRIDGIPATKVATQVAVDRPVTLDEGDHPWVSRGALKLLGAIDAFGVDPSGRACADLGSSTGGFTQVLLEGGARVVYAIDVGKGLLDWTLRNDERVVLMESTNARHLQSLPEPVDLIVGDLSFISFTKIVPTVIRLLAPGGEAVVLVKPQFEAGREAIGKKGRVRSEADRLEAIDRVRRSAETAGLVVQGGVDSTVPGSKSGNVEHFLHLIRPPLTPS